MPPTCRYTLGLVFGTLLQRDAEEFVADWNNHKIRRNRLSNSRPCDLYELPELHGMH